jgi:CBS domain-containing protein
MICPHCHAENIEGVDECVECGHALAGFDLPRDKGANQAPGFIFENIDRLPKREAVYAGTADPVGLAVRLMQTRSTGCILVRDASGYTAGIITGWDILQKVAGPREDLNAVTCGQIMTPNPMTVRDDDTVAVALNMMHSGGFRHLPVIRDNEIAGIIDASDLFRDISPNLV